MINVQQTVIAKFPSIDKLPPLVKKPLFGAIRKVIHENDINYFLEQNRSLGPYGFIESVLDYFQFSYKIYQNQIENIPKTGRVVIIANHPLGALDALSLIDMIKNVRTDIKVVANNMLSSIKQLKPLLIEVDAFDGKIPKKSAQEIYQSLEKEEIVIIFPSGEVSRIRPNGIKDIKWHKGFLRFATKTQAPILPIYIKAKNSTLFYTISSINKALSSSLLPHEMFHQKNKTLEFKIGELIPYNSYATLPMDTKTSIKLFRKHLYRIAKNKKPIFTTQTCIAHPEERQLLKEELKKAELLGRTNDGKYIYLYEFESESFLMREIGRLRELTFRKVEEGTGKKRDLDEYDNYYKHIILWDEERLEIVGSYRIAESNFVYKHYGVDGFYSNTLFRFQDEFKQYLQNSIELGRSFVQPKYWGSRALDYLWQGIGAYLYKNPHIRYMFGAVTLSSALPKHAQNLIVYYYSKYYGRYSKSLNPTQPFVINSNDKKELEEIFQANDIKQDFMTLRSQLKYYNVSIPTLYKHYTELCEKDGISFMGFNIDRSFNDCIDGFILIDISKIKAKKRDRYIKQ